MSHHTFVSNRIHIVFSVKDRRPMIPHELLHRLWAYIAGIVNKVDAKAYAIGGTSDHIHILIGLPPTANLAEVVQKIKANSSRWMHQQANVGSFIWQEGYAAFSISMSHSDATIRYIDNQRGIMRKRILRQRWKPFWMGMASVPSLPGLEKTEFRSRHLRAGLCCVKHPSAPESPITRTDQIPIIDLVPTATGASRVNTRGLKTLSLGSADRPRVPTIERCHGDT